MTRNRKVDAKRRNDLLALQETDILKKVVKTRQGYTGYFSGEEKTETQAGTPKTSFGNKFVAELV